MNFFEINHVFFIDRFPRRRDCSRDFNPLKLSSRARPDGFYPDGHPLQTFWQANLRHHSENPLASGMVRKSQLDLLATRRIDNLGPRTHGFGHPLCKFPHGIQSVSPYIEDLILGSAYPGGTGNNRGHNPT
jgi:hypothetical protein